MAGYGSDRADTPPDYRDELAEAAGFGASEAFVLPCQLRLKLDAFIGLALSSSHAAGVIELRAANTRKKRLPLPPEPFVASCDAPDAATMPAAQTTDQAAFPCR
jgi:hypothetical protein